MDLGTGPPGTDGRGRPRRGSQHHALCQLVSSQLGRIWSSSEGPGVTVFKSGGGQSGLLLAVSLP